MKDILNKRVKHRKVLDHLHLLLKLRIQKDYFDLNCPSPYMLLIAKVKKRGYPIGYSY